VIGAQGGVTLFLREQSILNLGKFHWGGTLFVVVSRVVDPKANRIGERRRRHIQL
jgi:hypothetical protein